MIFWRGVIASGVAALALVVAGCKGGGDASTPKQAGTATGDVVSARYDEVVLKQPGSDKNLRLTVDASTQVQVGGRIVMIERLAEGTSVRATYDATGKATRIEEVPKGGEGASAGSQTGLGSASETADAAKK